MKNKNIIQSFKNAIAGIANVLRNERNFKIHLFAALCVFALALFLRFEPYENLLLLFAVFFVLVSELINSAIEKTVDLFCGDKYFHAAKAAKDIAAAASLLACLCAALVGAYIFLGRFNA